jgi:monofunctional biosynthetic peptidoglycan transglycosylase
MKRWLARLAMVWFAGTAGVVFVLRFVDPPTTAFMLERTRAASNAGQSRFSIRQEWVPLSRISPEMQLAVIAAEDQKFAHHWGFDFDAIEDAVGDRLQGRSKRGASTLTQQVAKNLFLWPGRSFVRKGLEAYFTVLIEVLWSKRRILEVHLNVAEYGDGVYGVEAAGRRYFGRSAATLAMEEAALLAAVLPNPRARKVVEPTPAVAERARWIDEQARILGAAYLNAL